MYIVIEDGAKLVKESWQFFTRSATFRDGIVVTLAGYSRYVRASPRHRWERTRHYATSNRRDDRDNPPPTVPAHIMHRLRCEIENCIRYDFPHESSPR